jgi:UDP-N-acetylglucosamine 4-epimerase
MHFCFALLDFVSTITSKKKVFVRQKITFSEKKPFHLTSKYYFKDFRKGDLPHSNACIDKAINMLGYKPIVGFEEGIRRTIEYYLHNY